jgi:two-component system, cell cycle response regulator
MAAKILIVDDEVSILEMLSQMIQAAGYGCQKAQSSAEALEILRNGTFDIVLSDIRMPDPGGMALLKEIKAHLPDVDVVMMTGFDTERSFVDVIEAGATDFVAKPFHQDELLAKIKRIARERQLKAELLYLVLHDSLTGLYNRRYLYQKLQEEVERAKRQKRDLALIILDVDHFKDYNDAHGHLDGDQVLTFLGEILTASIRQNVDTVYRYGGDEFGVLLIETDLAQARSVAERIRASFESKRIDHCTLSIGVAQLDPQREMEDLIRRADQSMYQAKRAGGNRVEVIFNASEGASPT